MYVLYTYTNIHAYKVSRTYIYDETLPGFKRLEGRNDHEEHEPHLPTHVSKYWQLSG